MFFAWSALETFGSQTSLLLSRVDFIRYPVHEVPLSDYTKQIQQRMEAMAKQAPSSLQYSYTFQNIGHIQFNDSSTDTGVNLKALIKPWSADILVGLDSGISTKAQYGESLHSTLSDSARC